MFFGDYMLIDDGLNAGDIIDILGHVRGNVEGDGNHGNGSSDSITVELKGVVSGDVVGDGTFKAVGDAVGGIDAITVKGTVLRECDGRSGRW